MYRISENELRQCLSESLLLDELLGQGERSLEEIKHSILRSEGYNRWDDLIDDLLERTYGEREEQ